MGLSYNVPLRLRKTEPLARAALFLCAIVFAAVVRYHPLHADLDAGWAWAVNALPGRGVVFGRDVAFTYGPLARYILPMNVGSNLAAGIAFQTLVWAVFSGALALAVFVQRVPLSGLALFAAGLFFGLRSFDSAVYAGPDVAAIERCPGCLHSGFEWVYPSRKLGRGEHTLEFRIIHRDGESYYQSPRKLRFRIE